MARKNDARIVGINEIPGLMKRRVNIDAKKGTIKNKIIDDEMVFMLEMIYITRKDFGFFE